MDRQNVDNLIEEGTTVYGSDGEKLGTVSAASDNYIVVEKGFFFPKDYYIPMSAISTRDGDRVTLNVSKDEALNMGWDAEPADFNTATVTTGYATTASTPLVESDVPLVADVAYTDTDMTTRDVASVANTARTMDRDDDTMTIDVREEELVATKRAEEIGSVRVEKVVTEEDRAIDVPVSEERIRVTRRVVDRAEGAGDGADAFEETVIEVPLYGEDVDVGKRTRVVGEVEIDKEAVQSTRRVEGTVRREDVKIVDDVNGGVQGVIDEDTAVIDPSTNPRRDTI